MDIYKIVIKKTRIAEGIFFLLGIRIFIGKLGISERIVTQVLVSNSLFSRTVEARKTGLCLHHRGVTKTLETGITTVARQRRRNEHRGQKPLLRKEIFAETDIANVFKFNQLASRQFSPCGSRTKNVSVKYAQISRKDISREKRDREITLAK